MLLLKEAAFELKGNFAMLKNIENYDEFFKNVLVKYILQKPFNYYTAFFLEGFKNIFSPEIIA